MKQHTFTITTDQIIDIEDCINDRIANLEFLISDDPQQKDYYTEIVQSLEDILMILEA